MQQPRAIAQVNEHEAAQVAATMDPAAEAHGLPCMFGAKGAAEMCPERGRERLESVVERVGHEDAGRGFERLLEGGNVSPASTYG